MSRCTQQVEATVSERAQGFAASQHCVFDLQSRWSHTLYDFNMVGGAL